MSLRPILKKDLTVRSSETGTKKDIEEALHLTSSGLIKSKVELLQLSQLNYALNRLKSGSVYGKIVLDLRQIGNI